MEEQKIIEEGLKKNTKQDIICYVGMALLFIMIFIPPIFRVVFYDKEVEKNEIDVVYLELSCRKAVYRDGKKVSMIINNSYRDSILQKSVAEYTYESDNGENIAEVNQFLAIESDRITSEEISDGYKFTFDYTNDSDLFGLSELADYYKPAPPQMNYYKSNGYTCERTSTVEKEERK